MKYNNLKEIILLRIFYWFTNIADTLIPANAIIDDSYWRKDNQELINDINELNLSFTYLKVFDLSISKYKLRKILRELISEGILYKDYLGGQDPETGYPWCIVGYMITDKAKELPLYIDLKKIYDKRMLEIINMLENLKSDKLLDDILVW